MVLQQHLAGRIISGTARAIYTFAAVAVVIFVGWRVIRIMRALRDYRVGLEAEVASAEELNRLMQRGYSVFHDVPSDGPYNVDHVLVGPAGVFAIETKGRMKPTGRPANDGHIVETDGTILDFPGWTERKPVEQAERNARWLAKWLSSAVGVRVFVQPVLLLPGWW